MSTLERLARNQVLFREVNERVMEVVSSLEASEGVEFLCECSDPECTATIPLNLLEYEGVRSSSNLFVVAPGHERPELDRVVDTNERFTLVEKKIGPGLAQTDPRKRT